MTFSRIFTLILTLVCCVAALPLAEAAKKKAPPAKDYRGAIIMDAATGKVLFEDNADVLTPPASMTKLMTFAVLNDLLKKGTISLQTQVTIDITDRKMGGTGVWLEEKEVFPIEELLYAMMIQSANDAAHAIARASAGSVQAFVKMMNAKAQSLGMTHTVFRTPHGLPPSDRDLANSDLTSPRDFAILSRYLVSETNVLQYTSIRRRNFGAPPRVKAVEMTNHNHLVEKVQGVDGLKTGYTKQAMYCLATTAMRNDRRVVVVIMGSSTAQIRDIQVIRMINEGFGLLAPDSPEFIGAEPVKKEKSALSAAPLNPNEKKATGTQEEPMIKLTVPTPSKAKAKP